MKAEMGVYYLLALVRARTARGIEYELAVYITLNSALQFASKNSDISILLLCLHLIVRAAVSIALSIFV